MKILAIDDDETILELLRAALDVTGFEDAEFALSGQEALTLIVDASTPFDCVLSDIQMPEMDGIELCRQIRTLPEYTKTPVIMVTAMSDRDYIDRAFQAGATDYVTKPFEILELTTRLKIAEKLVAERRLVAQGIDAVEELQEQLYGEQSFELAEPLDIPNVAHALDFQAFDNYLLQLSRLSLFQSKVFAIKIADIEKRHQDMAPAEFRHMLQSFASKISSGLDVGCDFISYRGNGVFACINHKSSGHVHRDFEIGLQNSINELALTASGEEADKVGFVIGDAVDFGIIAKSGALNDVRKAIANAEAALQRLTRKTEEDAVVEEDPTIKQMPYKSLLQDNLVEGVFQISGRGGKNSGNRLASSTV